MGIELLFPLVLVIGGIVLLLAGHTVLGVIALVVGLLLGLAIFMVVRFILRTGKGIVEHFNRHGVI